MELASPLRRGPKPHIRVSDSLDVSSQSTLDFAIAFIILQCVGASHGVRGVGGGLGPSRLVGLPLLVPAVIRLVNF